jgi:hypothetical protein
LLIGNKNVFSDSRELHQGCDDRIDNSQTVAMHGSNYGGGISVTKSGVRKHALNTRGDACGKRTARYNRR